MKSHSWASTFTPFGAVRLIGILMMTIPHFIDGHMPHGYYILLRWIVCPVLAMIAYRLYESKRTAWSWVFGLNAAMFNPIFLSRLGSMWPPVDFATAVLVLVSFFLLPDRESDPIE